MDTDYFTLIVGNKNLISILLCYLEFNKILCIAALDDSSHAHGRIDPSCLSCLFVCLAALPLFGNLIAGKRRSIRVLSVGINEH